MCRRQAEGMNIMKKIIVLLMVVMLASVAISFAEGVDGKQNLGTIRVNGEFTLKGAIPEGYQVIPLDRSDNAIHAQIVTEDAGKPRMVLSIAYDETYADVERLNDLDEESIEILEKTFTDTDPLACITYDETGLGTRLLMCRTTGDHYDYLDICSIYKGYFIEFVMMPGESADKLTDEEIASCNKFLTDLDFVPAGEETAEEGKTEEDARYVLITGYDKEASTIDMIFMDQETLSENTLKDLHKGDTLNLGGTEVQIATVAMQEDEYVLNDIYTVRKNDKGIYEVYEYETPVVTEREMVTAKVRDDMVYMEGIDPKTGEPLENVQRLGKGDFIKALEKSMNGTWIGYNTLNVKARVNGGEVTMIERYYAPWQ